MPLCCYQCVRLLLRTVLLGEGDAAATPAPCPLVASTFCALSALDFMVSDGVLVADLVEVSADANVTEAMKRMDEHKLSSVLVSREEVVKWSSVGSAFGHGYAPIPITQKVSCGAAVICVSTALRAAVADSKAWAPCIGWPCYTTGWPCYMTGWSCSMTVGRVGVCMVCPFWECG